MQKKIIQILCNLIFWSTSSLLAQVKTVTIMSPDQTIVYSISLKNGLPEYVIKRKGNTIVDTSNLGLVIGQKKFRNGNSLKVIGRKSVNNSYVTRGIHRFAVNKYNEVTFQVVGINLYKMEVRVFNDGLAFRYIISGNQNSIVTDDLSTFRIPVGSTIWSQDDINYYEGNYQNQPIEEVKKGQVAGPPMTVKLPDHNGYAAITESHLVDFAGMSLSADGNRIFKARLSGVSHKTGVIETPWRVILIGATLNQLVNSDVISNLSSPPDQRLFPKGYRTSWIRPGKSVWSWLAGNGDVTFEYMKRFSSWAGELGIEYNLVDEGWGKWESPGKEKWAMMKELVDYSHQKGVKIWVWKAYPDRAGIPGIKDSITRNAFFKKCKEIGIVGLKIDFFDSEAQEIINFYHAALKDAAKYQLMLNFHGANKPTGESRTWPNEMTREGIMGLEGSANWAKHNTTLIFTRFLAGHADYTPLSFSDMVKGTTLTHQLACVAAFTSPFMCLGVDPERLLKSNIRTMVRDIPVVWDETIILPQSEIGEIAVMARRSGKTWYLVILNGESTRSIKINLNFLGTGKFLGTIFQDVEKQPEQSSEKIGEFNRTNDISIKMLSGGGFLAKFSEINMR